MRYELRYWMVCTVDGDVDQKESYTEVIQADNDKEAIMVAVGFLETQRSGLVIPYGPSLHEGTRLIAWSNPAHPPTAHTLAYIG